MANACSIIMQRNVNELKSPLFYRALVAEFVGTFLLIFIGCFSVVPWGANPDLYPRTTPDQRPSIAQVALCFGVVIGLLVTALGNVSGCHINPAVTIPMLLTRKISLVRAIFYLVFQSLGSILAIFILQNLTPSFLYTEKFLIVQGIPHVSSTQIMFAEAFITFILVFTVFAACDSGKPHLKSTGPLSIGLSVTVGAFSAGNYTGGCMNPARAFGPAVMAGYWDNQWIYWCGPILGGIVAGLLYDILFDTGTSPRKVKKFLTTADYEPAEYVEDMEGRVIEVGNQEEAKHLHA